MNCYDCAVEGRAEPAVGTCISCGAGVCRRHVRVEEQDVEQGSLGPRVEKTTRRFVCTSCDQVLADQQSAEPHTVKKASLVDLASSAKSALVKHGTAVAQRTRPNASTQKTREELYEEARRRGVKGRSKMDRDELARALGHS